jgi:hypothetical protein
LLLISISGAISSLEGISGESIHDAARPQLKYIASCNKAACRHARVVDNEALAAVMELADVESERLAIAIPWRLDPLRRAIQRRAIREA